MKEATEFEEVITDEDSINVMIYSRNDKMKIIDLMMKLGSSYQGLRIRIFLADVYEVGRRKLGQMEQLKKDKEMRG